MIHLHLQTQFGEDRCTQNFRVIVVTDPRTDRTDYNYTVPQLARSVKSNLRGRPRTTWRDTMVKDISQMNAT